MRRILVDHARAHHAGKRGGNRFNVSLRNIGVSALSPILIF